ncbi:hypothetical protein FBU30_002968, partial [Linnemannia zychae]
MFHDVQDRQHRKSAHKMKIGIEDCRQIYSKVLLQGTATRAQDRATKIVRKAIDQHSD